MCIRDRHGRRSHALATGAVEWVEPSGSDGVLAFRNGDVLVVANTGSSDVPLPAGELLLASADVVDGVLPADTTAWLRA